jgi:hypothetical protein
VASLVAAASLAAEEDARIRALVEKALSPRAEADAARDRRRVAEAQLESARRALDLVRTNNAERRTQAEAEVERARAALESARSIARSPCCARRSPASWRRSRPRRARPWPPA